MSLAVLANHMASKGRNGDTMLVHMTPEEVQGLHALALAHGGSLTINPETGLPEANFLKRLLPMIAGMALNAFLPGVGTAIGSALGGLSGAVGTGILVGGVTGLATGSLKQGIMAGLGAYGGASLGAGLSAAGSTPGAGLIDAANVNIPADAAARAAESGLSQEALRSQVSRQMAQEAFRNAGPLDQIVASAKGLTNEAGRQAFMSGVGGASGLYKAGAAALAPGMLEEPVKTTTQQPDLYKMYRRPMAFDQYTQTFEPLAITEIGKEPVRGNSGGIVALADGGPTAEQLAAQRSIVADPQAAALAAARSGIAAGLTNQQIAEQVNTQYGKDFSAQNVADFMAANQLTRPTAAPAAAAFTPPTTITSTDPTQQAIPTAAQYAEQLRILPNPQQAALDLVQRGLDKGRTAQQIADIANLQYGKTFDAQNVLDFIAANNLKPNVKPPAVIPPLVPGTTPGVVTTGDPFKPDVTTMGGVREAYERGGGSTTMPTITDIKPTDRTYTQNQAVALLQGYLKNNPNAQYQDVVAFARNKGIPEMQARAAYNEFRFSGLTGGSSQAYDYLMGRGTYPVKPFLPSGTPIMRPYAESVGLAPQEFYSGRKLTPDSSGNLTASSSSSSSSSAGAKDPNEIVQWRHISTGAISEGPRNSPVFTSTPGEWEIIEGAKTGAKAGGLMDIAAAAASHGGHVDRYNLGGYSDGGRLLRGPGDGVSDSIPAVIGNKQPARLADGEFVVPARIVSEIGNGSTEAGARKLYAMMDRVQRARSKTVGKGRVAKDTKAEQYLPA